MGIFRGFQEWAHHVYESTGVNDAFRAVMTNALGKVDNTLLNTGSGSGLDADTVDGAHYETGTFTPTLTFGGGSTGMSATYLGSYVKIGRKVDFYLNIVLTAKGSSTGAVIVGNLPFTNTNNNAYRATFPYRMTGATLTGDVIPFFILNANSSSIAAAVVDSGIAANMTDAHFSDTTTLWISGSYIAAS